MARDPKMPVTFDLPDNDRVSLITWEYVVDKFDEILGGIIDNTSMINTDLKRIDTKLDEWVNLQK